MDDKAPWLSLWKWWIVLTIAYSVAFLARIGLAPYSDYYVVATLLRAATMVAGLFVPIGWASTFGILAFVFGGFRIGPVVAVVLLIVGIGHAETVWDRVRSCFGRGRAIGKCVFNLVWLLVLTAMVDLLTYGTWVSWHLLTEDLTF